MRTYSKTLELADYDQMVEPQLIQDARESLGATAPPRDYKHRAWEYGLVLNALRKNKSKTVLDIGGNGSIFGPSVALQGMSVLQIDSCGTGTRTVAQAKQLGLPLPFLQMDFFNYNEKRTFDAVTCISVLEHVRDDTKFFNHLLTFVAPGGLVALTVDFHPSGKTFLRGHLRTNTGGNLQALIGIAEKKGFALFDGSCNYVYNEAYVYDAYTFASLVMKRGT